MIQRNKEIIKNQIAVFVARFKLADIYYNKIDDYAIRKDEVI